MMCSLKAVSGSNPPSANFFRLLCSVHLPQKVRRIFGLKMQKTGPGTVSTTIPKPVFSDFTEFRAISAPKTRKLPDLSGRQIRQSVWWGRVDSNHRRHCQQIYSLSPLATREHPHMRFTHQGKDGAGRRIRTPDLLITNQLLYRLSYTSRKSSEGYNSKSDHICQHQNKSFPAAEALCRRKHFTPRYALPRSPQRAFRALLRP